MALALRLVESGRFIVETSAALDALGGLGGLPPAGLAAAGEAGAAGRAETGDSPAGPFEKGDLENGDLLSVDSFDDMIGSPLGHQIIIRFDNYSHS